MLTHRKAVDYRQYIADDGQVRRDFTTINIPWIDQMGRRTRPVAVYRGLHTHRGKYDGAALRAIRAAKSVGRPCS
jgi:hypothetical protein